MIGYVLEISNNKCSGRILEMYSSHIHLIKNGSIDQKERIHITKFGRVDFEHSNKDSSWAIGVRAT